MFSLFSFGLAVFFSFFPFFKKFLFFNAIFIFIFFLKASKGDQYISVGGNDIILPKSSSVELQSMQSESSASVPAEHNQYVAISPVHESHPTGVIKKEAVKMITKSQQDI